MSGKTYTHYVYASVCSYVNPSVIFWHHIKMAKQTLSSQTWIVVNKVWDYHAYAAAL